VIIYSVGLIRFPSQVAVLSWRYDAEMGTENLLHSSV